MCRLGHMIAARRRVESGRRRRDEGAINMSSTKHTSEPSGELIDVVIGTVLSMSERNSYVLVVQNKTKFTMRRVESHNDSDN